MYKITVVTSSEDDSGTDSGVFMKIYGEDDQIEQFQLMYPEQDSEVLFQQGNKDHFEIELIDVGKVRSYRIVENLFFIIFLFFPLNRLKKLILVTMPKVFVFIGIWKV